MSADAQAFEQTLRRKSTQLKHAITKENADEPSQGEIDAVAAIYNEKAKDLPALAKHFGIDLAKLQASPPENVNAFAKDLFAGKYTTDEAALALAEFRKGLRSKLPQRRASLKKATTKEIEGPPSEGAVQTAVGIYNELEGNLRRIADRWELSLEAMTNNPPESADDFAKKLLMGAYTADQSEAAKAELRSHLRKDIRSSLSHLRKSITKEYMGPSEVEVASIAQLFPSAVEELPILAERLGISMQAMMDHAPKDADDFARKVLAGVYTEDQAEAAKAEFRLKLHEEVKQVKPNLKTVKPRRMSNVSDDETKKFEAFYEKHDGDLRIISAATGITLELLQNSQPKSAAEFAQNLLTGVYTVDMCALASKNLRWAIYKEVRTRRDSLTKVTTKEWDGAQDSKDIAFLEDVYTSKGGDLLRISKECSLSLKALTEFKPKDKNDFAKKVLLGYYSTDAVAAAQKANRLNLISTLKDTYTLKRTETKVALSVPTESEVAMVAKVFNDLQGNPEKLIQAFGADPDAINKAAKEGKLTDSNDFAMKLLAGQYSMNFSSQSQEGVRERMQRLLADALSKSESLKKDLKRSTTKEYSGEPLPQDVAAVAQVFTEQKGDLAKIAEHLGCDAALLKKDAPTDAQKFAAKYLSGGYETS